MKSPALINRRLTFGLTLSAALALSLTSVPALAKTPKPLHALIKAAKRHSSLTLLKQPKIAPLCTNFTGEWEGTCIDQHGDSDQSKMSIQQEGCKEITVDGMTFNINGLLTLQSAPNSDGELESIPYGGSIAYGWNDSQTRLSNLVAANVFGGALALLGRQTMWLEGDQLRTQDSDKGNYLTIDDSSFGEIAKEDCIYNRVHHP